MTTSEQEHIAPLMPAIHLPRGPYHAFNPGPESLIYTTTRRTPRPNPSQYLLKVQTTSLTRNELTWPEVLSPSRPEPAIPGHDICGIVLSTPQTDEHCMRGPKFKVGDEVFGLLAFDRDGGAADCVLALEEELAFKPRNVSAAVSCAVPLSGLSAWQAFFGQAGLTEVANRGQGEAERVAEGKGGLVEGRKPMRVLITNASGGVGVQAVQLLRSQTLFGTQKFWICGTCSGRNEGFVKGELGADEVIDYTVNRDISEAFRTRGWEPVDIVFDCVGGETLRQVHSPAVVRDGGVVVSIAQPPEKEWAKDRDLKSSFFIVEPNGEQLQKLAQLVEAGELKGYVEKVYDLIEAREAMNRVESARVRGKVVLRVNHYTS